MKPGTPGGVGRPEFEAILEQSIEEGLSFVLGESGAKMVISEHPLSELSADPSLLHEALKRIFMESGAAVIEREIGRRLLDAVGSAGVGARRTRRSWLIVARSSAGGRGRATARERRVLREFMTLAFLPKDHQTGAEARQGRDKVGTSSFELTSLEFASAFKKGS